MRKQQRRGHTAADIEGQGTAGHDGDHHDLVCPSDHLVVAGIVGTVAAAESDETVESQQGESAVKVAAAVADVKAVAVAEDVEDRDDHHTEETNQRSVDLIGLDAVERGQRVC